MAFHSTDGWFNIFGLLKGKAPLHDGSKDNNLNAEKVGDAIQVFEDAMWMFKTKRMYNGATSTPDLSDATTWDTSV